MYNEEEIADSLEFCEQIQYYYHQENKAKDTEDDKESSVMYDRGDTSHNEMSLQRQKAFEAYLKMDEEVQRPTAPSCLLRGMQNLVILLVCVFLAYLIASAVTKYVAHETTVEGESMEPTLANGDSIIIQKLSYYFSDPKRYDVVVFPVGDKVAQTKKKDATYYVKRVIGLPGETVQIKTGKVFVNDKELKGDKYYLSTMLDSGNATKPVVLGEDEYFVLGDNRNMSTDSRSDYVGKIHRKDIIGEVWLCVWPFSHMGLVSD